MASLKRISFLDTLRAFIILLVIAMHASLSYVTPPFLGWIHDAHPNDLFWAIGLFAESGVLMPILFFISGYLALPSLLKRGPREFVKGKLVRLGIPYLVGITMATPVLAYMSQRADGGQHTFTHVLARFFTLQFNSQYHLWYLGVLLVFLLALALVRAVFPQAFAMGEVRARKPSPLLLAALVGTTTLLCFALNLHFSYSLDSNGWTRVFILQFQNVKVPFYIAYFLLGMYAYRNGWFSAGYVPRRLPWTLSYVVSFLCYSALMVMDGGNPTTLAHKLIVSLSASVEVLSALLLCLAIFQRLHRVERPRLQKAASLSYGAYLVHMNVLFAVLYVTRNMALPALVKYPLQVGSTVAIAWGIALLWRRASRLVASRRAGWTLGARPTAAAHTAKESL